MVLLFASLYFTHDLNFSIAEAGLILSFFGVGSVLGSFTGGWLTDRRNYYDILVVSLIVSGSVLFLLLWAESKWILASIIFFYAFTSDMFRPANAAAIAAYSTPANRTRSVSLYRLAINLGFSVGPAAGGFIALYLGYKWLFVIDALTSYLAAILLMVYLKRPASAKSHKAGEESAPRAVSAYRDLPYLVFIFLVTLFAISFFQLFVSLPQFFKTVSGYKEDTIGLLMAFNGILVVLIEMPVVAALEKRPDKFNYIVLGNVLIPIAFSCLYFGNEHIFWALLYTVVITLSEILAMPFMMNYSLARSGTGRQGEYSALYSISYGVALIAAPSVGLGIADHYGFRPMLLFFMGMGALVAVCFVVLKRKMKQ